MESEKKRSKQSSMNPTVNVQAHGTGDQAAIIGKTVTTVDSLPLEMLECILGIGGNTSTLKTWRLVSKSWNKVCCRILRNISAVSLKLREYDDDGEDLDLEGFKDLIIDRQANFPSDWPNPFQNFKMFEVSFATKNLTRFVQRPNVKITTLEILHDEGFNPVGFESILEHIKGDLMHLKICVNSDSVPFLTLTERLGQEGGWSLLRSLSLMDTCKWSSNPCPHVQFIIALKKCLQLEEIVLKGDLRNIARVFQKEDQCWDNLIRLELELESAPLNVTPEQIHEFMKWTEEINFRPLTSLCMWFNCIDEPQQASEQYTPYFLPLIQKSSQVAEELFVNFVPCGLIPSLPKLKNLSLAMMDGDRIQEITEHSFPSLTAVLFHLYWTEVPTYVNPKDVESNKNVVDLTIFWSLAVPDEVGQELLWSILSAHFPNLKSLCIDSQVSSSTLHAIRKRLPKLEEIRLNDVTSSELLGTNSGPALTAKGWPHETFENCALLEMAELTDVTLGQSVILSKEVISACLGKMLKVKFLSFSWNSSLQASDIPEHLGHVQDVTIVCTDNAQRAELEKLTKTMECLTLLKHPRC